MLVSHQDTMTTMAELRHSRHHLYTQSHSAYYPHWDHKMSTSTSPFTFYFAHQVVFLLTTLRIHLPLLHVILHVKPPFSGQICTSTSHFYMLFCASRPLFVDNFAHPPPLLHVILHVKTSLSGQICTSTSSLSLFNCHLCLFYPTT